MTGSHHGTLNVIFCQMNPQEDIFFHLQSLVTPYILPAALRIDVWSNNSDVWLIIQELINVKPEESRDYSS